MNEILSEFNELLKRKDAKRIGVIENSDRNTDCAVTGKDTVAEFKESIEEAIKESLDLEDVAIISAQSFDYGYKIEVKVGYVQDEQENEETYYISHCTVY